jgi:hypothetical protein
VFPFLAKWFQQQLFETTMPLTLGMLGGALKPEIQYFSSLKELRRLIKKIPLQKMNRTHGAILS